MTPSEKRELENAWYATGYDELGIGFGTPEEKQPDEHEGNAFIGLINCFKIMLPIYALVGLVWWWLK